MACIYNYKGHVFGSEAALDDFLLEREPLRPKLGDAVFSMTSALAAVVEKLQPIHERSKDLWELNRKMLAEHKATYDDWGEASAYDPPYIGVNKFLATRIGDDGKLLFPEFRDKEYWDQRFSNWKIGKLNNFTPTEIEEFGLTEENVRPITNPDELEAKKKQIQHRWEVLAKCGTAFHTAMEVCFSETDGQYNFKMDSAELKALILKKLTANKEDKYINDRAIDSAIKYAKKLDADLQNRFGPGELTYFPELMISQETNEMSASGKPTILFGIIDLLVIDSKGRTHILDYKTSVHGYSEFNQVKKQTYSYQLATYQRMLEKEGISSYQGEMLICPVQLQNFRKKEDTDDYEYDDVLTPSDFITINTSTNNDRMWRNIDAFMPLPFKVNITTQEATLNVQEMMAKWFPEYSSRRKIDQDYVIDMLKRYDALKLDENGLYKWKKDGKEGLITATTEADFVTKVLAYEQSRPETRIRLTGQVKNALDLAMKNYSIEGVEFPTPVIMQMSGDEYRNLLDTLKPYCNGAWEIMDNPLLESFGIIGLKTKDVYSPKQIEFVRVTTNELKYNHRNKIKSTTKAIGLTGAFESDIAQQSKTGSLMLEAVNGNIELMETLLIINQMRGIEGYTVGNITVVNPRYANSLQVSNEELLYCWKELNRFRPVQLDRLTSKNPDIKFADRFELARANLDHLMEEAANDKHPNINAFKLINGLRDSKSMLDLVVDTSAEDKIKALKELDKKLRNLTTKTGSTVSYLDKNYTTIAQLNEKEVRLHNDIMLAIAQLKGINFRQLLRDHDRWCTSKNVKDFILNGWSGTYMDNPGNMDSETLNLVTRLVTEAYQNVRDEMQREKVTISKLIENLKKAKNLGVVLENTFANQVDLYKNMTEVTANGDFVFKNPNQLQGAEKAFLEYALDKINRNRYPKMTDDQLENMKNTGDPQYYRVPLARGGTDSQISTVGLMTWLRSKLRFWNPKNAWNAAKKWIGEGLGESDNTSADELHSQMLFSMTNMFDNGEKEDRLDRIKEIGIENLEHNLETLLYKHLFAYSVKENIDGVFPMIKAAMIHMTTQGALLNHPFNEDIHYFENYIKAKIFNQSITDPRFEWFTKTMGVMRSAVSKFILAFSPVLAIYQPLQGLWNDISLMIRKPDGGKAFTFGHFLKALRMAYSDLLHFSDKPTLCSLFNETYGLNDMDMNTYTERISESKKGIWNFWNFALKCATRPDYYNRSTIFLCQMMGDGCLEAHHVSENGELIYDWKKDKRFEAFANGRVSDPKYNQQKALYYEVARQFEIEHAKNRDGSDFKLDMNNPMALPRAYTNKQAEAHKSLADDIYGYYSHEKKSLVQATTLGAMWLQFKTYWSGKKNQYLQTGGVRLRGDWTQVEMDVRDENGNIEKKKMFYPLDANGQPDFTGEWTYEDTGVPVMRWLGQWQEGIMVTLATMAKEMYSTHDIVGTAKKMWNIDDPNLRRIYLNNIKLLGYDLMMLAIGGGIIGALLSDWLKDLKKKNAKEKDFATGCMIAAANVAVCSLKYSFLDFNIIDTVGGPLYNWQPLMFSWSASSLRTVYKTALGDEDIWDAIIKTPSSTRYLKPMFDSIKPEIFDYDKKKKNK